MKVVVAEEGKFMETLGVYAGTDVAVLPYGFDWSHLTESADPFAVIPQTPSERFPIDPQGPW